MRDLTKEVLALVRPGVKPYQERRQGEQTGLAAIDSILVHRCDPWKMRTNLGLPTLPTITAVEFARMFCEHDLGTGWKHPYPLMVWPDGRIDYVVPLELASPHARVWNSRAIGVVMVGDFRHQPPPLTQYSALINLLKWLVLAYCQRLEVNHKGQILPALMGHGEAPGADDSGNKKPGAFEACPGDMLKMDVVRFDVQAAQRREAVLTLQAQGLNLQDPLAALGRLGLAIDPSHPEGGGSIRS